jgi:glycosyltransferase involved in cell wall biosynthesis
MQRRIETEPRILFVACTPLQANPSTGVDQRMRILYDAFATVGHVDFFQADPPATQHSHRDRALGALRDDATRKASLHPLLPFRSRFAPGARRLAETRPESYDVVFLHRLAATWWTGWTDRERTIVDIDDIPSQIIGDRMRDGTVLLAPARAVLYLWCRFNERQVLRHFRFGLVCSERDRRYLAHAKAVVVPNSYWQSHAGEVAGTCDIPSDMLFVGSLGYPPNAEGLRWFVESVLPRIRSRFPNATLTVIGRMPSDPRRLSWSAAPGVRLIGAVDDVTPYIRGCRFEICPLRRGQGTRIKILESLANGKAVVTTAVGAYGLELDDEHGVFQCDDERSFAETCAAFLSDNTKASKAAAIGQQRVKREYGPDAVAQRIGNLVDKIVKKA